MNYTSISLKHDKLAGITPSPKRSVKQKNAKLVLPVQHNRFQLIKKMIAFTLAEVLITLTILGVLATIMVPNLYSNYQKRLTITKLQMAQETLEKAAVNIAANSGCLMHDVTCTGLIDNFNSDRFIELAGIKVTSEQTGLVRARYLYCENQGSNCNDTAGVHFTGNTKLYVTNKNIGYVIIRRENNITTLDSYVSGRRVTKSTPGFLIYVFTETSSKITKVFPKLRLGRNVFVFTLYGDFQISPVTINTEAREAPQGVYSPDIGCNKSSIGTVSGRACAAKIIQDGWKINY